MALYCGIDLHSNNHVVVVIDEEDRRVVEKRLPNSLERTAALLAPYRQDLVGVAVESTFNWYWLVDGLLMAMLSAETAVPVTGAGGAFGWQAASSRAAAKRVAVWWSSLLLSMAGLLLLLGPW